MSKTARYAANPGRLWQLSVRTGMWMWKCAPPLNSYSNHVIAFTTAAMIPTTPAKIDSIPTKPPRTLARDAETMPISPNPMATSARTKPKTGPVMKLKTAATMAISANTLNFAGAVTCCCISQVGLRPFSRKLGSVRRTASSNTPLFAETTLNVSATHHGRQKP